MLDVNILFNRQGLMTSKTNNITKDGGCGSLHTKVLKTIVKRVGYRIQYKGRFYKKGGLKIKKGGLQTPLPTMI